MAKNKQIEKEIENVEENKEHNNSELSTNETLGNRQTSKNKTQNKKNGNRDVESSQQELYTLAEAYPLMLKGAVFRFKEWDKLKLPYVAFVKRGHTKIYIANSVDSNSFRPYRPSQESAIKKEWYIVKYQ